MTHKRLFPLILLAVLSLLIPACSLFTNRTPTAPAATPTPAQSATPLPTVGSSAPAGPQPAQVSGEFTYSNDFVLETYYVEHAVALVDMHGFVIRDENWLIPVESQTLGFMKIDRQNNSGKFWQQLPVQPAGVFNDVDNNGQANTGVQIFSVAYWPNLTGGPFSEGDDPTRGWPSYLASIKADTENQDEVIGGKLVIWAPDDQQKFPTGFGDDGKLFTADDPTGPVPAGYAVIDLDQQPFGISQEHEPKATLYEPADVALKDYSGLSYSEAFQTMFDTIKKEYAFNGVAGKQPDWDALYAALAPRVKDAESKGNGYLFYQALLDYTHAFKDGHVGLNGANFASQYFSENESGGYGFSIRQLDDGSVMVVYVLAGGPAEKAGIQVGDRVTQVNDQPVKDAIGAVQPFSAPFSSDFSLRSEQERYLLRGKIGDSIKIAYTGKSGGKTVTLKAVDERQSLAATSPYNRYDPNALPVVYRILDSGIGYVQVNSNNDDLGLIVRLFQRALQTFQNEGLKSVIIDMRLNFGGSPLGLAGFLTDQEIPLGQLAYYSDKTGQFEPEGTRQIFYPNEEQYRFDKIALLVDQTCFSACEIEAYGFAQLPGIQVIGQYPSAGVEAEVARGQFQLPEGMSVQVPTGRFTLPDGSLFLEGQGVQPTLRVPITAENVLSTDDVVLQAAEKALQ